MSNHNAPHHPQSLLLTIWASWTCSTAILFASALWLVGLLYIATWGLIVFVAPLLIGVLVGIAQARVLTRIWPSITQWGTATIIGLYTGLVSAVVFGILVERMIGRRPMELLESVVWVGIFIVLGVILGLAQSRQLPLVARQRYAWISGNGCGVVGMGTVLMSYPKVRMTPLTLADFFVMTGLATCTFAAITGSVVVWLVHQSGPAEV